jgi:ABC-type lipoprotein release transport system permease subunit
MNGTQGYNLFSGDGGFIVNASKSVLTFIEHYFNVVVSLWKSIQGILIGIALPISVFLIIVIVYCVEGLKRIRNKEEQMYDVKVEPAFDTVDKPDTEMIKRWEKVKTLIASHNPSDWKQAIIEADIMLDNLLTKIGYQGETLGEKLKRVEPADFNTLNEAWEAHKVRNNIAHEGLGYELSENEAKQVFGLYKKVFEEFYYI